MSNELKFFSYKIMPVDVSSFDEFLYSEDAYSREDLEDEVKQELLSQGIEADLDSLSFTVREGHLFAEGFGNSLKKEEEVQLQDNNNFHLLKRLIMLSHEILSEFQQRLFGKWRIEETGTLITIISKSKVIMTLNDYEPIELDYELSVGNKGYCWQAAELKIDFEVVEETENMVRVKIPGGAIVTLVRY